MLFKKLLAQSGGQTDIFWKFYSPVDTLWSPKTVGRVLGYTTDKFIRLYIGHTGDQLKELRVHLQTSLRHQEQARQQQTSKTFSHGSQYKR